ncbi:MAG: hypothetical protein ABI301_00095, partial [Jatrophihabitantaceae bacterium]
MSAPVETLTGFARALRAAGVAADRHRLTTGITALTFVDPHDTSEVYWATRLSLCSEPDDLPKFDALFQAWFGSERPRVPAPATLSPQPQAAAVRPLVTELTGAQDEPDEDELRT